jgi:hypothetical protein
MCCVTLLGMEDSEMGAGLLTRATWRKPLVSNCGPMRSYDDLPKTNARMTALEERWTSGSQGHPWPILGGASPAVLARWIEESPPSLACEALLWARHLMGRKFPGLADGDAKEWLVSVLLAGPVLAGATRQYEAFSDVMRDLALDKHGKVRISDLTEDEWATLEKYAALLVRVLLESGLDGRVLACLWSRIDTNVKDVARITLGFSWCCSRALDHESLVQNLLEPYYDMAWAAQTRTWLADNLGQVLSEVSKHRFVIDERLMGREADSSITRKAGLDSNVFATAKFLRSNLMDREGLDESLKLFAGPLTAQEAWLERTKAWSWTRHTRASVALAGLPHHDLAGAVDAWFYSASASTASPAAAPATPSSNGGASPDAIVTFSPS